IPNNCRINTTMQPYGAVIDSGRSDGVSINAHPAYLYFTNTNGNLRRINTTDGSGFSPPNGNAAASLASAYGITIDHRDRAWTPHSQSPAPGQTRAFIHRYTPATNNWASFSPSACVGTSCGTTCTSNANCSGQDANHNVCSADLSSTTNLGTNYRGCTRKCAA